MVDQKKHDELVKGLRDLADWLEARPSLRTPCVPEFNVFAYSREDFNEQLRLMGSGEKDQVGGYLTVEKAFGPVVFALNISQNEVCTRTQVGVREVEAQKARTVPIYEWECPESFMKEAS